MERSPHIAAGWCGTTEVDERWMTDWVEFGIAQLCDYLAKAARFDAWRRENGR